MNMTQIIRNHPITFSLDHCSRATSYRNTEDLQQILESHGLCISNDVVAPLDKEHHENWFNAIRAVSTDHQPRLVIVRAPPNMKCAYLSKDPNDDQIIIKSPLRRACDSDTINELSDLLGITPREREVLLLVAAGYEPKTISRIMGTTTSTVKTQLKSVCVKTGTKGMRDIIVLLSGISELRAA